MTEFKRVDLESYKYNDLMKLAKKHEVFRRYATKAELIVNLLSLNKPEVENLTDVSMPSFTESEEDDENSPPNQSHDVSKVHHNMDPKVQRKEAVSVHTPLAEASMKAHVETLGINIDSPIIVKSVGASPLPSRRSLAGPAVKRQIKQGGGRLKRQSAINIRSNTASPAIVGRLTRQRTFDINSTKAPMESKAENQDLQGSALDSRPTIAPDVKADLFEKAPSRRPQKLKREGTFNLKESELPAPTIHSRNLRREGTFEVKSTKTSRGCLQGLTKPVPVAISRRSMSEVKQLSNKSSKIPDFKSIHKRLMDRMESVVDSKLKVIDRANSMQKNQIKLANHNTRSKVVRKLISPKAGKSKLSSPQPVRLKITSPKPVPFKLTSPEPVPLKLATPKPVPSKPLFTMGTNFSSNMVAIRQPNCNGNGSNGEVLNRFGFSKSGPRREAFKAAVMERKPVRRLSPNLKRKQVLQTVRLNKRFDLLMKHRLAQKNAQDGV